MDNQKKKCDIGIIGLAVMGQNLVLNMESNGYRVAVYNRTTATTKSFIEERACGKKIEPAYSIEELVGLLKRPRKVMLMVKAGLPVDKVIESLVPYLEEGDIIIDGGNSHFKDTDRRYEELTQKGIRYLGTGISGGEYGALHGPSIMPGGEEEAYNKVAGILEAVAARTEDGPCVTYLGPGSAGHYVKMVHNGIEYGVMQLIAEIYDFMRRITGLEAAQMSAIFKEWNKEHQSYLLEITYEILERVDEETGKPLVDLILDQAKQKGTGKWSVQDALELGEPIPMITAAVLARNISALKDERITTSGFYSEIKSRVKDYTAQVVQNTEDIIKKLGDALYLGIIIAYAEGMKLLQTASHEYGYGLQLDEVARIWEDGCIIRSALLKPIQQAYKSNPALTNLIISEQFKDLFFEKIEGLRDVVTISKEYGIPIPALSAALDYFDSLRTKELPANLIQAQRDYFGAHTYQRIDKEGIFHTEWQDIHNV